MSKNKPALIGAIAGGLLINTLFGLYNLKTTQRIKTLTKPQIAVILLINILNTGFGLIHLIVNAVKGAYRKPA